MKEATFKPKLCEKSLKMMENKNIDEHKPNYGQGDRLYQNAINKSKRIEKLKQNVLENEIAYLDSKRAKKRKKSKNRQH